MSINFFVWAPQVTNWHRLWRLEWKFPSKNSQKISHRASWTNFRSGHASRPPVNFLPVNFRRNASQAVNIRSKGYSTQNWTETTHNRFCAVRSGPTTSLNRLFTVNFNIFYTKLKLTNTFVYNKKIQTCRGSWHVWTCLEPWWFRDTSERVSSPDDFVDESWRLTEEAVSVILGGCCSHCWLLYT